MIRPVVVSTRISKEIYDRLKAKAGKKSVCKYIEELIIEDLATVE